MERLPKKNLTAKIVALVIAIILWVYVMNEQNPLVETSMEIPLEVRNLSSSVIAADIPEVVRVKVRGPRALIVGLAQKDVKAYIDLKGLGDGRNKLNVTANIPANVELVEIGPSEISFRLDTIVSHEIPVEVKVDGTPAPGAIMGKISYNTSSVTVKGPSEIVDTVVKGVVNVDISGKSGNFTINEPVTLLDARNKKVEGLTISPGEISTSLIFSMVKNKKMVPIKPNIVGVLGKGITLNRIIVNPEEVEVSGDEKSLEKVQFIYTEPINVSAINKETVAEAKLQMKDGILVNKEAVTVTISVTKQ